MKLSLQCVQTGMAVLLLSFFSACSSKYSSQEKANQTQDVEVANALEMPPPMSMNEKEMDLQTESYAYVQENDFQNAQKVPLSTFSIDVDAASYSNVRRFVTGGQLPPVDAVRIEELVNYFDYDYPQPTKDEPFSVYSEISQCPWNTSHYLVHIGLQGKKVATENLPSSNLVFLIDVSGSMEEPNKLPLLQKAFELMTDNLRASDKISIVVYAGAAGLVLPATSGADKETILEAIGKLQAGGSTAGGEGIQLAYRVAEENFIKGGNNRIILATDGDFNVGVSSDSEMIRLVEKKRESGVFLTVIGFGSGNYKDSKMEGIADHGNGNYYYIDSELEAKKVLVTEMGGTLLTIAKDVKIQVEFNPVAVRSYRLVGYENRLLNDKDFEDDTKDAGEIGAGHTVTALYELELTENASAAASSLKYQTSKPTTLAQTSGELLTLKLRYKQPDGHTSQERTQTLYRRQIKPVRETSDDYRFSAAVASYGMLLRQSAYKGTATYEQVLTQAKQAKGHDLNGYRNDFIELVKATESLPEPTTTAGKE